MSSDRTPGCTLVVLTASYPYEAAMEQTFLEPELPHWTAGFTRVVLVPAVTTGQCRPIPSHIEIDEDLAKRLRLEPAQSILRRLRRKVGALRDVLFYQEIVAHPRILIQLMSLKRLAAYIFRARQTAAWAEDFIIRRGLKPEECVFYSYWLDAGVSGLGLVKTKSSQLVIVSRAHGTDLYEFRAPHAYLPCRVHALRALDALFPDSDAGRRYMLKRYPWVFPFCHTARLGVGDPGGISAASEDGTFRIVSCSLLLPLKRVHLILQGIAHAAILRPHQLFSWTHFGTGPLKEVIEKSAKRNLPGRVDASFPGYTSAADLIMFYRLHPVDVFLNVSETEGTPVAVMEAISCGIPVAATSVGGNVEIVSEENGVLMPSHPSPGEVAATILRFVDGAEWAKDKRKGSLRLWQQQYDASHNFSEFAELLKTIRLSRSRLMNRTPVIHSTLEEKQDSA